MAGPIPGINLGNTKASKIPAPKNVEVATKGYFCPDQDIPLIYLPPNISPPLNCSEIEPIAPEIIEFKSANDALINNKNIKAKKNLSPMDRAILLRYERALKSLVNYAYKIYFDAYLSNNPHTTDIDLKFWHEFELEYKQSKINITEIELLLLISDKQLNKNDKTLLFNFFTSKDKNVPAELFKRLAELKRTKALNYNGWQGHELKTAGDIFSNALTSFIGPFEFEKLLAYAIKNKLSDFLASSKSMEYLKLSEEALLKLYTRTKIDFNNTPPGTKQKIRLSHQVYDLSVIILSRGTSLIQYDYRDFCNSIPDLSPNEYGELFSLNFQSSQETFKSLFIKYAEKYFIANNNKKPPYGKVLSYLDSMTKGFNISNIQLDKILTDVCDKLKCSLSGKDKAESMGQIKVAAQKGQVLEVSPENLPSEVIKLLQKSGYWNLVKDNLRLISFMPDIKEGTGSGSFQLQAAGAALPLLKRVEIDVLSEDEKTMPAWEIASILVHEAAHVKWRSFAPALFQQSIPDERNSFAVELDFFNKIQNSIDDDYLDITMLQDSLAIKTANEILGYSWADESAWKKTLPSIKGRGVSKPEELDLSYYPTMPSTNFLENEKIFSSFVLEVDPKATKQTINLLWQISKGEASLEVITSVEGEKANYEIYIVKDERKTKLTDIDKSNLAHFLFILRGNDEKDSQKHLDFAFLGIGHFERIANPAKETITEETTIITSTKLKSLLWEQFLQPITNENPLGGSLF